MLLKKLSSIDILILQWVTIGWLCEVCSLDGVKNITSAAFLYRIVGHYIDGVFISSLSGKLAHFPRALGHILCSGNTTDSPLLLGQRWEKNSALEEEKAFLPRETLLPRKPLLSGQRWEKNSKSAREKPHWATSAWSQKLNLAGPSKAHKCY